VPLNALIKESSFTEIGFNLSRHKDELTAS